MREVFHFDNHASTKETLGRNVFPKVKDYWMAIGSKRIKVETANWIVRIDRNIGGKVKRDCGNIGWQDETAFNLLVNGDAIKRKFNHRLNVNRFNRIIKIQLGFIHVILICEQCRNRCAQTKGN